MDVGIAERLQKLRKEHGYSQEQLADELGVSRQAVSKWERAEASPDTDNLILLARLYNVSLDELLFTEEESASIRRHEEEKQKEENGQERELSPKLIGILSGSILFATVIAYVLCGCLLGLWHPLWILFLLFPVVASFADAVIKRDPTHFAYPVLVAALYLTLGFTVGLWHPLWVLFLTIPLYYLIADIFKKKE